MILFSDAYDDENDDSLDQYLSKDENSEDIDTSYDLSNSRYVDKIKLVAVFWMGEFFKDKFFWAGGKITKGKLFKEEHVRVVMEMNILDAYAIAYYCLEKNRPDTISVFDKHWEIKLVYDAHAECREMHVPKCYVGGILLVYLSVCHGIEFIPVMKKISEIRAVFLKQEREAELKELIKEQKRDDR